MPGAIFDILPGAGWPGTDGTRKLSPPRAGGNIRQHTQQRMTLIVKSPISSRKAEYEGCAAWSIPRGVSSHHVLRRAFGDAYYRREKVRHATLLSAPRVLMCKHQARGKGQNEETDVDGCGHIIWHGCGCR